jgi:hypothetical protein
VPLSKVKPWGVSDSGDIKMPEFTGAPEFNVLKKDAGLTGAEIHNTE